MPPWSNIESSFLKSMCVWICKFWGPFKPPRTITAVLRCFQRFSVGDRKTSGATWFSQKLEVSFKMLWGVFLRFAKATDSHTQPLWLQKAYCILSWSTFLPHFPSLFCFGLWSLMFSTYVKPIINKLNKRKCSLSVVLLWSLLLNSNIFYWK